MAFAEDCYPCGVGPAVATETGFDYNGDLLYSMQCDHRYPLYHLGPNMVPNWLPLSMDPTVLSPMTLFQSKPIPDTMEQRQPSAIKFVGSDVFNKLVIDPGLLSKTDIIGPSEPPPNLDPDLETENYSAIRTGEVLASLPKGKAGLGRKQATVVPSRPGDDGNECPKAAVAMPTKTRVRRRRNWRNATVTELQEKKERLLQRNRVSATKCRQNRKAFESQLQESVEKLGREKRALSTLVNSLKEEALSLKGQMLDHSNCDCQRIRAYLHKEADSLAYGKGLNSSSQSSLAISDDLISPVSNILYPEYDSDNYSAGDEGGESIEGEEGWREQDDCLVTYGTSMCST